MRKIGEAHRVLVRNLEYERPFGVNKHTWKDNEIYLKKYHIKVWTGFILFGTSDLLL
jgi:hypothetical protein